MLWGEKGTKQNKIKHNKNKQVYNWKKWTFGLNMLFSAEVMESAEAANQRQSINFLITGHLEGHYPAYTMVSFQRKKHSDHLYIF